MKAIVKTDRGRVREENQDSHLCSGSVFAVADGMGGHKGGQTASSLTIHVLEQLLPGKAVNPDQLVKAIDAANRRVHETAKENADLSDMGTTLSLLWAGEKEAWIGHVGDSRIYRFRDGKLEQLTQDHSLVGDLLRNRLITPELARTHPYRNYITKAVGLSASVDADVFSVEKKPGDRFLICSDGLSGMLEDRTMEDILQKPSMEEAADTLLQEALNAGGYDNVTLLLLEEEKTC